MQSNPVFSSSGNAARIDARLPGKIVFPSDPTYDQARLAWNLAVDQRPELIVFPENTLDIIEAVTFAGKNRLPVAVQSTGHGVLRKPDGAVLINTSRLKGLWIDPQERTAWVEAGVKWGEVLEQAQQYGLAPLLGSSPSVGAVGYTLGGGMGWLCRKYGMSLDSVLQMHIVTPDGILRTASQDENPDLFWALRGGGGGFGVVTGMQIRLHPVSQVYAGSLFYPPEEAGEVMARFNRWADDAPDELSASVSLMNYPPIPEIPEFLRGRSYVVVRGCYVGPVEQGEKMLSSWRSWQAPVIDDFKSMPFSRAAEISQDPIDPLPFMVTGGWLRDLSPQTVEELIYHTLPHNGPPMLAMTEVRLAGGAISRVDPASTAYSHRGERLIWMSLAPLMTPGMKAAVASHFEEFRGALGPALTGKAYMNFLGGDEAHQRTSEGYSPEALQRLQAIKARYDPNGVMGFGYDLGS